MKGQDGLKKSAEIESRITLGKTEHLEAAEPTGPQSEEAPRAEEYSLRSIYENTPVMMHTIGANQELVSVNRIWLETLGYEEDEVIGHKSSEFLTEESRRYSVAVALPKFMKTGSATDVACQMVKKNGEVIDVLFSAIAEMDASGQFIRANCCILDVNEHRTTDDLWRQLALVEERNRMSRDLHDTVEHSLIGIMLRTDTIRDLMDSDPLMARAELESTHALAKLGLEQARHAVWDLEPLAITSNPIKDVISRGLSRLADEGIKTSLVVEGEEPHGMDQRNRLAVIRIVQEALSNVRLHSQANTAKVWLSYTRSCLMLRITDDGVGFDLSTTHSALSPISHGIGLANIRESGRLAGGSVDVRSSPGSGTQVEANIPFENGSEHGAVAIGQPPDHDPPTVTNRELEVLQFLAKGGRNKDIAVEMSVSLHTIKFHIENLYKKLDVRTRAELIRVATQLGILT